jgi:hypothetical protein
MEPRVCLALAIALTSPEEAIKVRAAIITMKEAVTAIKAKIQFDIALMASLMFTIFGPAANTNHRS